MQLVANQQLVKNRVRLGAAFHIGAFALFLGALLLTTQTDVSRELPILSWVAIVVGMGLYSLGQTQLRRWGPRNRQEEQLGQAIRSLDDRYKLYAFLATNLPDYILVSPAGVHVLVIRSDAGQIACVRDKWTSPGGRFGRLFGSGLGNPSADVQRQLTQIKALLTREGLEADVPVSGMVILTNPRVTLRVEGCSFPVTRLKDLKDVLRRTAGKGQNVALSSARVRDVQTVFDRHMQAAHTWR
ncbi:MAG TPA: nuclease-related domain-containing protein [Chloroflexota bacterium]|nr:nuclease-related domain-containing protein [Chloroflexota bacterium]